MQNQDLKERLARLLEALNPLISAIDAEIQEVAAQYGSDLIQPIVKREYEFLEELSRTEEDYSAGDYLLLLQQSIDRLQLDSDLKKSARYMEINSCVKRLKEVIKKLSQDVNDLYEIEEVNHAGKRSWTCFLRCAEVRSSPETTVCY